MPAASESLHFYRDIKPFSGFDELFVENHYSEVPDDWSLVMTDVRNSTVAVSEGLYKEVNVVGVSAIIVTKNACVGIDIPFIFGGDGATLIVPNSSLPKVIEALSHNRTQAKKQFHLDLRIAIIPITAIREQKKQIRVAKMNLSEGNSIAMIQGDGVSFAESLMKKDSQYLVAEGQNDDGDVTGLECRWDPIHSLRGEILTLIIQAQPSYANDNSIYQKIVTEINGIVPIRTPAQTQALSAQWPPKFLDSELKMRFSNQFSRALRKLGILILTWIFAKIIKAQREVNGSKVKTYLDQLSMNSDYVKFDDTLKMVIDVTTDQSKQIRELLDSYHKRGILFYGHHATDQALMTCYIQSLDKHIHFIDGANGGYTLAAKCLKSMRALK